MITNDGYRTLTKIIREAIKLDVDKHGVSYEINITCVGSLQIYRAEWEGGNIKDMSKIYDRKLRDKYFSNDELNRVYLQILDEVNALCGVGGDE